MPRKTVSKREKLRRAAEGIVGVRGGGVWVCHIRGMASHP